MSDLKRNVNDFSGDAENVIQVGSMHGDINVHSGRRLLPSPHQLPSAPSTFINRMVDLAKLDHSMQVTSAPLIAAIAGLPGVGKTAFALHWADRVRGQFPDGQLYIDMHGYGRSLPLTPAHALDIFLRALNVQPDEIPDGVGDRASLFRSVINGRRLLIMIDNVASSDQVRPLLPAVPGCCAVITSRSSLQGLVARDGAMRIRLDTLSLDDSVYLLAELLGADVVARHPADAVRVADLCGRLPLTLRVVAERAASLAGFSLADLVVELESERSRLDAVASSEDELSDARAVFSWSYSALSDDLRRVFRVLSLHPGSELAVEPAAALLGLDVASARRSLRDLASVHLVEEVTANRFRFHDLLKSYSLERVRAEESQVRRTVAVRRLLTWYLHVADAARYAVLPYSVVVPLVPVGELELPDGFESGPAAMTWFEAERFNLIALLRHAHEVGQYDICWKMAMASSALFEIGSYWSDWEDNHRLGLAAAVALGDEFGEAANTQLLGDAAWRLGGLEDARVRYSRSAELAHRLAIGWLEGFAFRGLGLVAEERGEFGTALGHYHDAIVVFREHDVRRGVAMSMLSLGKCKRELGDLGEAIAMQRQAISILKEIGDVWSVAWASLALAQSLADASNVDESTDALKSAITVFRRFQDYRAEIAASLTAADRYEEIGNPTQAIEHLVRVVELYSILGDARAGAVEERIRLLEQS
ncbi:ATP-binding protein [Dactylosporangium sp. NPDC000521]|uniref:ATP-binding protein n=1 Tax=Dactylosporangium sp. NPDC000521 TaxID=3363975 RepID=UPI0036B5413C